MPLKSVQKQNNVSHLPCLTNNKKILQCIFVLFCQSGIFKLLETKEGFIWSNYKSRKIQMIHKENDVIFYMGLIIGEWPLISNNQDLQQYME